MRNDWREDLLDIDADIAGCERRELRLCTLHTRDCRRLIERVKDLETYFGRVGYPSDWDEICAGLRWALDQLDIYADWNDDSDAASRVRCLRMQAGLPHDRAMRSGNEQKEPRA